MPENNTLSVSIPGGSLVATACTDSAYPGIDVCFIPDDPDSLPESYVTDPRVLVEYSHDMQALRALSWVNPQKEDYSDCCVFASEYHKERPGKEKRVLAYDIAWDTDGDTETKEQLPSELLVPKNLSISDEDGISDWLSDATGWCHAGFSLKYVTQEEIKERGYTER